MINIGLGKPMVDEIRLGWNTLMPYIEEVARVAQERAEQVNNREITAEDGPRATLCVATR